MRLAACVLAWACLAGVASAQRAPIVYAGQNGPAQSAGETEYASVPERLAGGDERSYGYGAPQTQRSGAVIDIRRAAGAAPRPQAEPSAPEPMQARAEEGPVQLFGQQQAGAQPWLEQERVGPPYEANGRWYVPTPEPGYAQTGEASWYGPNFHGQATASGETYDQQAMTAAHPTLPLQSLVQVTNLANGREVIVRINDRGPFVGERLIDLSRAAADVLGFESAGRARVHVRYLGPAPRRVNADGAPAPTPAPAAPVAVAQAPLDGPAPLWQSEPAPQADNAWNAPTLQQTSYAPAPRAPAPAAGGAYVVQVGAFSDPANAQRVRAAVSAAGPVEVDVRRSASGAELFRVRVGPWASAEEADSARRTLATLGYPEAVVATR